MKFIFTFCSVTYLVNDINRLYGCYLIMDMKLLCCNYYYNMKNIFGLNNIGNEFLDA